MIKNLNEQKVKLKENISKEIDEYFEELSNSSTQSDFDINVLEKFMVENQKKMKKILNETNSTLAGNVETDEKKTAPDVENP
jgi:hypothetical protein